MSKPGPKAPHGKPHVVPGTLRAKAWRAMQIKGKFSLSDICRCVLTGEEAARDPRNNLGRYIAALAAVGVLQEMKRRMAPTSPTSNGEKRWLMVKDLGRQAPIRRTGGVVFDPNTGTVLKREVDGIVEAEVGHE